ncbi:aldo/keto reductase [Yinghuangia sp. ASG 101]|uniref:aldo/keto reductase n=1 Tax=Yinghuangia sp. ASG 101 TaxID=2896848 RepID=UPI001E619D1D|nr:aldo/keto reductase [Yinghuangia sp. ASG 101]UGQ13125.1 aldo/keto reductase [Yinghuangia sp. ASG 101]
MNVGTSGLKVSEVGLGCNNFGTRTDEAAARDVVAAALDAGVTLFDTAEMYGDGRSEEMLGRALAGRRDDAVIATKFGMSGDGRGSGSRRYVMRACEASLKRLGTDHIDLYYLHFPDPDTPIDETLAALDDLVRDGKVRYIANSNMAGWQLVDADHIARAAGGARFVATQLEWSLLERGAERETVPAAYHVGVGVIPYFPLKSGLLSGKYRRGEDFPEGSRLTTAARFAQLASDANFAVVERLTAHAEATGRTILQLALSWLAARPEVSSVLVGATTPEQVTANARAFVGLTEAEAAEVGRVAAGTDDKE